MKKEIEEIKKRITPILKKNKVRKAGIFGSYATGKQTSKSDIDLLVEINDKNFSLLDLIKLKLAIQNILKKKVDLIEYSTIHPLIREKALIEEVRIL